MNYIIEHKLTDDFWNDIEIRAILYVANVFENIFPSRFVVNMSDCGITIFYAFIPMMSCNTEFSTMGTSASDRWRGPRYPYRLICLIYVLRSFDYYVTIFVML